MNGALVDDFAGSLLRKGGHWNAVPPPDLRLSRHVCVRVDMWVAVWGKALISCATCGGACDRSGDSNELCAKGNNTHKTGVLLPSLLAHAISPGIEPVGLVMAPATLLRG